MTDLTKKLSMDHLSLDDDELRSQLEAETQADEEKKAEKEKPPEKKADPRDKETYTFNFKWTSGRGVTYSGTFTNKILAIGEKQQVSVLESNFNGGQPYDSIESMQQIINRGIAHMTFSLVSREKMVPKDWAKNLRKLHDENLVIALFGEVSAHEAIFHGRVEAQDESPGEEGDATPQP